MGLIWSAVAIFCRRCVRQIMTTSFNVGQTLVWLDRGLIPRPPTGRVHMGRSIYSAIPSSNRVPRRSDSECNSGVDLLFHEPFLQLKFHSPMGCSFWYLFKQVKDENKIHIKLIITMAICRVMSEQALACGNVQWWRYNAVPLGDQVITTILRFVIQSKYSDRTQWPNR